MLGRRRPAALWAKGAPGGWSTAAGRVGVGMRGSGTFCSGGDAGAELIAVSQSSSGRGRCAGAPGASFGGSRNEAKSRKSGGASRVCAVWRLAPISGAAASPIGAQTSARPASKEASAPEAGLRGFRPSSTETAIMYGPMLRRSPSRKRCGRVEPVLSAVDEGPVCRDVVKPVSAVAIPNLAVLGLRCFGSDQARSNRGANCGQDRDPVP